MLVLGRWSKFFSVSVCPFVSLSSTTQYMLRTERTMRLCAYKLLRSTYYVVRGGVKCRQAQQCGSCCCPCFCPIVALLLLAAVVVSGEGGWPGHSQQSGQSNCYEKPLLLAIASERIILYHQIAALVDDEIGVGQVDVQLRPSTQCTVLLLPSSCPVSQPQFHTTPHHTQPLTTAHFTTTTSCDPTNPTRHITNSSHGAYQLRSPYAHGNVYLLVQRFPPAFLQQELLYKPAGCRAQQHSPYQPRDVC